MWNEHFQVSGQRENKHTFDDEPPSGETSVEVSVHPVILSEYVDDCPPAIPVRKGKPKSKKKSRPEQVSPPLLKPRRSKSRSQSPETQKNVKTEDESVPRVMSIETGVTSMEEFLMVEKDSTSALDLENRTGQAMADKSDIYLRSTEKTTMGDSLNDSQGVEDHGLSSADSSLLGSSGGSGYGRCTGFYSRPNQMSPLGEMLTLELEDSPRSKRKLLAKLSKDYDEIEVAGTEGGKCGLADEDLNPVKSPADDLLLSELIDEMFKGSTHQLVSNPSLCNLNTQDSNEAGQQETPVPTVLMAPVIRAESYNSVEHLQEESSNLMRPAGSFKMDRRFRKVPGLVQAVDLHRSMEDGLDTHFTRDGSSIGSFNELSQSLDSLLKDVQPGSGAYDGSRRNSGANKDCMNVEYVRDKMQGPISSAVMGDRVEKEVLEEFVDKKMESVVHSESSNVENDLSELEPHTDLQENTSPQTEDKSEVVYVSTNEVLINVNSDEDDEVLKNLYEPLTIRSISEFSMISQEKVSLSPMKAEIPQPPVDLEGKECVFIEESSFLVNVEATPPLTDAEERPQILDVEESETCTDDLVFGGFNLDDDILMTSRNASAESLLSPDKEAEDIVYCTSDKSILIESTDEDTNENDFLAKDLLITESEFCIDKNVLIDKEENVLDIIQMTLLQGPVCTISDRLLFEDNSVFSQHIESSSKDMLVSPTKSLESDDLLIYSSELHSVSESQTIPDTNRKHHKIYPMERTPSDDQLHALSYDSIRMEQNGNSLKSDMMPMKNVHTDIREPLRINTSGLDIISGQSVVDQPHVCEKKSPAKSPAGNLKFRSSARECSISSTDAEKPNNERKRNPPQRKKSVRELLSKFESGSESPPSDGIQEIKFRPLVQTKRVVKVQPKSPPVPN